MILTRHFDCCHMTVEVGSVSDLPDTEKHRIILEMTIEVIHVQEHPECAAEEGP